MLRALLIAETREDLTALIEKISIIDEIQIVDGALLGAAATAALQKYQPEIVIASAKAATLSNDSLHSAVAKPRQSIMASTHQGIQFVPLVDILYFRAEDKYVTAHHKHGELLIEDTMASLELEFAQLLVRIHRKTLVSINKIERLYKDEHGKHFIKLYNQPLKLEVSRRQLTQVRKILLCK